MAITTTDVCNMALSYLNRKGILSMDEDTEEARMCKIHYDHSRRRLLRIYPWGFAKRIEKLALYQADSPGWEYVYAYPEKCLFLWAVFDEEHADQRKEDRQDFETALITDNKRAILTDVEGAYAEYTFDVTDPGRYSEEFLDALAHILAADIALGLTGNMGIQQAQLQLAQSALQMARLESAVEQQRNLRYPMNYAKARG